VSQIGTEPLEMRETILGYSSSPAMSAMLAVLKLYYVRQDTYIEAILALQQAQVRQRKLCKRVRNQVENAVRERNEAQARMMQMSRERDEAMRFAENRSC